MEHWTEMTFLRQWEGDETYPYLSCATGIFKSHLLTFFLSGARRLGVYILMFILVYIVSYGLAAPAAHGQKRC